MLPPELQARRLETLPREELLARYRRLDELSRHLLVAEFALIAGLITWLLLNAQLLGNGWPWLSLLVGSFGTFHPLPYLYVQARKRLEDIDPKARIGAYSRDDLVALSRRVMQGMGLPPGRIPVYLVREKEINAHALRMELLPGLHLFHGVYLNRSLVHLLGPAELASVIGHELGHLVCYSPLLTRCLAVHAVSAGLIGMVTTACFPSIGVAIGSAVGAMWMLGWIYNWPQQRLSRTIEFLCDDQGAVVAGLVPAVSAELKIALEQATRESLLLRAFQAKRTGQVLSTASLMEAYEAAVPFGQVDVERFEAEFKAAAQASAAATNPGRLSLDGFLEFLSAPGGDDTDEAASLDAAIANLEALRALPRMDLGETLNGTVHQCLSFADVSSLAQALESDPGRVIAPLAAEVDDRAHSHPSTTRRILYLWRNRAAYPAIES